MISLFRALPELALVGAGEHRFVLLTLMLEHRAAFSSQLRRTQRHGHLDFVGFPFLPGATIQADLTLLGPGAILQPIERAEDSGETNSVRAVRIGKITGRIN